MRALPTCSADQRVPTGRRTALPCAATRGRMHLHIRRALLAVLLTLTACGSSGESAPAPSASTLKPLLGNEDRAVAAYRGMWTAYAEAGQTADPTHPSLARYADGKALAALREALRGFRQLGQRTQGAPVLAPNVAKRSAAADGRPATVEVVDCVDTTQWLVYAQDGELADDKPGGRRRLGATVTEVGGVWKVTLFGVREVGTC